MGRSDMCRFYHTVESILSRTDGGRQRGRWRGIPSERTRRPSAAEAVEGAASVAPAAAEKSAEVESARLSRSSAQIPEEAPDELKFCRLDGADDILHEADNL